MKDYKEYFGTSTEDTGNNNMYIVLLKGLVVCFALSLVLIMIYALVLSYSSMTDESMAKVTQTIVILSVVLGAIYGGRKLNRKGWLFGLALGLAFVVLLIPISVAFGQQFTFDKFLIARLLAGGIVGMIGGVIGVNLN